jgi:UDP-3-O-[3-hydroxymyristoyl] glucosamine N-acyltransferase
MQHPGFFQREGPYPLSTIAERIGAELVHAGDGAREIDDLRPLHLAAGSHLTFCTSRRYAGELAATQAAACLIKRHDASLVPVGAAAVITDAPHRAFAMAVGLLYPEALQPPRPDRPPMRRDSSSIAPPRSPRGSSSSRGQSLAGRRE